MNHKEFSGFREKLNKTQKQMAQLLGVSIKTVQSYEQGWRAVPAHVERQFFFLLFKKLTAGKRQIKCWVLKKCPARRKNKCPAWEFKTGEICWFINGTICDGSVHKDWQTKMTHCRACDVFKSMQKIIDIEPSESSTNLKNKERNIL